MSNIIENIKELETIINKVESHCMCLDLTVKDDAYVVIFPSGYDIDGVRATHSIGKAKALGLILKAMDEAWDRSCFWK